MRHYSVDEEERVRTLELVREWTRSGLLETAQAEMLAGELRVELRRTNPFLRAGLALFTALIVAAFVGLVIVAFDLRDDGAMASVTAVAAIACIGIAEFLVATYRCYRFGVEEVFAMASAVLIAIGGVELVSALQVTVRGLPSAVGLAVGSAAAFGLYRRFGFIYAALGSFVCAAAIPFRLNLPSALQRVLAAAVLGSVFVIVRAKRLRHRDDYPGDEYGILQGAAVAGVYAVLNVQLSAGLFQVDGWFYWCTYAVTWIVPAIALRLGIRDRDRVLLDVSLLLAIITLVTSKPYLGWPRNAWDPMVFGVVLIALAVAMRRWLENGPGGERSGWTAARMLDRDRATLSALSQASALVPAGVTSGPTPPRADPPAPEFGGGRSGGGGGGGTF